MSTAMKSDVAEATELVTLIETLKLLRGQVGALERQVAAQQAEIEELKTTPLDPSIVERLVPREIFEEGARLLDSYVAVQVRLRELKREHRELHNAWDRAEARVREGGKVGPLAAEEESQIRETQERLEAEIAEKFDEIEAVAEELKDAGRALSRFSRIRVLPNRLPESVEVQE